MNRCGPGSRHDWEPRVSVSLPPTCERLTPVYTKHSTMHPFGTIGEILSHKGTNVWSIGPDATVFDAIHMMADKNVGALLVTQGGKLIGIITERDYTRKVALKGKSSKETAVRDIISGQLIHVTPAHTVEECMHLMTDHRVR